jgi:hypothetical protein
MDPVAERFEKLAKFREKLIALGLPHQDIKVFGMARLNIHVITLSRGTAERWVHALATILPGCAPTMVEASWKAKENKGTVLLPTMRHGWLVGVIA